MTIKIIGIHIPSIFLSFASKADNTTHPPSHHSPSLKPPEKDNTNVHTCVHTSVLDASSSTREPSTQAHESSSNIHHFKSVFENSHVGGIPYEAFE
ncbi:MAG: hypothetical protein H0X26_08180 [Alphaproteobacteria bacterium]|nr:hypothetical protein [Alphaproteobacteria bacterium]